MNIEINKISDLYGHEAEYNPRKTTPERLIKLERNLREFGDLSGIVFNRQTGNIVGGHQRQKVLDPEWEIIKTEANDETGTVALGYVQTPFGDFNYREVDWSQDKEIAANMVANDAAGEWDQQKKKSLLNELNDKKYDMTQLFESKDKLAEYFGEKPDVQHLEYSLDKTEEESYHDIKQDIVDSDSLVTVKINLPKWMVDKLDEEYGKYSRSDGIRQRLETTFDEIG